MFRKIGTNIFIYQCADESAIEYCLRGLTALTDTREITSDLEEICFQVEEINQTFMTKPTAEMAKGISTEVNRLSPVFLVKLSKGNEIENFEPLNNLIF